MISIVPEVSPKAIVPSNFKGGGTRGSGSGSCTPVSSHPDKSSNPRNITVRIMINDVKNDFFIIISCNYVK
jgi:hypothetical protein